MGTLVLKREVMAQRRMFSPDIVQSDAFLEMPASAQALYFHLGMRADDDGFVNPKMAMRMLGSNEDDLKILIAKRFVLQFESAVLVIKHWRINNFVRKDRYKQTNYLRERSLLRVRENQSYTLTTDTLSLPIAEVAWKSEGELRGRLVVDQWSTQDRLGKVRLGKELNTSSSTNVDVDVYDAPGFKEFWVMYPNKRGKGQALKTWKKLKPNQQLQARILQSITDHLENDRQWKKDNGQFIPHPSTFLNARSFDDEITSSKITSTSDKF